MKLERWLAPQPISWGRVRSRALIQDRRRQDLAYYVWGIVAKRVDVRAGRIKFTIRPEHIEVPECCPITGQTLRIVQDGQPHPFSPALVMIRPKRGWVPGNVQVMSLLAAQTIPAPIDRPEVFPDVPEWARPRPALPMPCSMEEMVDLGTWIDRKTRKRQPEPPQPTFQVDAR